MPNPIAPLLDNPLPASFGQTPYAAILGDHPSQYSKSPKVWNAALRELGIPAHYQAMDVAPARLPALVRALRDDPNFRGANATVPHKVAVLPLLDALEARAALIGAVNTIARTPTGGLKGFNTDAPAGLDALTQPFPGQPQPLFQSLRGTKALLLGAGGAARALAFALAEALTSAGHLYIFNRNEGKAEALARAVSEASANASPVARDELAPFAIASDLIVNATSVGQSGAGGNARGQTMDQEPFSPLSEVEPEWASLDGDALRSAVQHNHEASLALLRQVPSKTAIWDIIYSPAETVLLRQARATGHRTLNGKSMLVHQAAASFYHCIFRDELAARGLLQDRTYRQVLEIMAKQF